MDELIERLGTLTSCQICDGIDELGLPLGGLPGILPLDGEHRVIGRAFTVKFSPIEEDRPPPENYLQEVEPGDVVVLAANGVTAYSVWGGKRSFDAVQQRAAGVVIDGAYRDVEEHRELDFPVFGRSPTPMGLRGRYMPTDKNVPVTLCGVEICPGDLVVGDASGVVAIPDAKAEEIIEASQRIVAKEQAYFAAVQERQQAST